MAYGYNDPDVDCWFFGPEKAEKKLEAQVDDIDLSSIYKSIESVYEEFENGLGSEFLDMLMDVKISGGKPDL